MDIETIQKRIQIMEKYEEENRQAREMINSELESDDAYRQAVEEVKEIGKKKKLIKQEIMARDNNVQLGYTIKQNNEEIAAIKEILSVELVQYYTKNQTDKFTDAEGETRLFKLNVKLLPKRLKD